MAVILWAMGLSLLAQCCLCSVEQVGCLKWRQDGNNVCCDACHPGNRLVRECGPSPKDLCKPCEPKRFTTNPKDYRCKQCTQCVGALVLVKECTSTTDTQCGCKEGLMCGDAVCSFCIKRCDKGQEPTENRSCKSCPEGTFNNQIHQKCKPWSKCPGVIESRGDAFNDVKCANVSVEPVIKPAKPDDQEQTWPLVVSVATSVFLIAFTIVTIVVVTVKIHQKRQKTKKLNRKTPIVKTPIVKTPIIRTPTDDPATLIAIECSFHEAQQEQGSSSESLDSKESTDQLIGSMERGTGTLPR
ncbi:tumor necrosis factor receptor superfamily member 9a [Larimichthys crocea]|uniref:tumor necrosis factor receptor superfamily member 9a n=1 Tax=Larimichthys crocea TaxID=215358 RepID=UPI000901AAE2|nr:tumor necrosis factor receptor superfamily member 9 [Larimichthys crocea]